MRGVSVVGTERPVLSSAVDEGSLVKLMCYVLVPQGTERRASGFRDDVACTLLAHDLEKAGVRSCYLVTEPDLPDGRLAKALERADPRAVAGISMFLEPGHPWEMPDLAEALVKIASAAFEVEAFVLMMLVSPKVVIDRTGPR